MSLMVQSALPRLFSSSSEIGGPSIVPLAIMVRNCSGVHLDSCPSNVRIQKPPVQAKSTWVMVHFCCPRDCICFAAKSCTMLRARKKSFAEVQRMYSGAIAASSIHLTLRTINRDDQSCRCDVGTLRCKADQVHMKIVTRQLQRMDHVPRPSGSGTQP